MSTFAGALEMIWPVPAPGAIGAMAFELPVPTIVTTPLRTGGTSLALAEISFGTRFRSTHVSNQLFAHVNIFADLHLLGFRCFLLLLLLRYRNRSDQGSQLESLLIDIRCRIPDAGNEGRHQQHGIDGKCH